MPGLLPDFAFRVTAHDRMTERRKDDGFLESALADPASRVLVLRGDELAADDMGLALASPADAPAGERLLLGSVDGVVYFVALAADDDASLGGLAFAGLRLLASTLDERQLSLAVHATALGTWHLKHPMCSVCGTRTDLVEGGASRSCPSCGTQHFPRTDPAVIMLVVDAAGRCLLGHNGARAATWFSTLAGFVEPGESLEEAVAREVLEETGVVVTNVTYAGSQPWPFPSSLMLGFLATASTVDIQVDGEEITEARWFTREQLAAEVEAGELVVPTTVSIAGALLSHWYGGPLPKPLASD
ncbi:MAG TPA: NAD(+) diphosphatase [Nocardioidaceae bacterium]|nr:NAD(+) diphosphatase [Nocardioidaceae bacterium]